jgi:hypothetical protein
LGWSPFTARLVPAFGGAGKGDAWRGRVQALLDAEGSDTHRHEA